MFFKKANFFPKIPNFCRIGLPLSKTYWKIVNVSPQKGVKKSLQFVPSKHSYIKAKNEFWGHFKNYYGSIDLPNPGNAHPRPMGESLCLLVRPDVDTSWL